MASYEDLFIDIRADAHQAPDFVILRNIQAVSTEFFTRTGAWEQRIDDISLLSGVSEYELEPDSWTQVVRVVQVWRDSVELQQLTQRDILRNNIIEGLPTRFSVAGCSITVHPVPGTNEIGSVLRILACLAPQRDSEMIPDYLFSQWRDALVYGTKARMLESPTQPWSNPQASQHFRNLYNRELRRAKSEAMSSNGAQLRVSFPEFA